MKGFKKCRSVQDGIVLLDLIRTIYFNKNLTWGNHGLLNVVRADKNVYLYFQESKVKPSEYIQEFKGHIAAAEGCGSVIGGGGHALKYVAKLENKDLTTMANE